MIRALAALGFLMAACFGAQALATPVIADLSQYRIEMDSSFNGTRLFLFGVRNDTGDVVVVVRGPLRDYMLRKKERIMGIWVNSDRMKFYGVPDFYAIALSRPMGDELQKTLFTRLGIDYESLLSPPPNPALMDKFTEYSGAFLAHQQKRRLYTARPVKLDFMGESLFKIAIDFPDTIPPGNYTAEIYLISDGEVMGMQSTPIRVSKSGLDAFLYNYAHDFPALYGITAIVMALGAGWFSSRIFEKA